MVEKYGAGNLVKMNTGGDPLEMRKLAVKQRRQDDLAKQAERKAGMETYALSAPGFQGIGALTSHIGSSNFNLEQTSRADVVAKESPTIEAFLRTRFPGKDLKNIRLQAPIYSFGASQKTGKAVHDITHTEIPNALNSAVNAKLVDGIILKPEPKLSQLLDPSAIGSLQGYILEAIVRSVGRSLLSAEQTTPLGFDFPGVPSGRVEAFNKLFEQAGGKSPSNLFPYVDAKNTFRTDTTPNLFMKFLLSGGNLVRKYANGGQVDSVPAMLTPGEFVVTKEAAQRIGYGKLEAMNKGVAKFATGGRVSAKKELKKPTDLEVGLFESNSQFEARVRADILKRTSVTKSVPNSTARALGLPSGTTVTTNTVPQKTIDKYVEANKVIDRNNDLLNRFGFNMVLAAGAIESLIPKVNGLTAGFARGLSTGAASFGLASQFAQQGVESGIISSGTGLIGSGVFAAITALSSGFAEGFNFEAQAAQKNLEKSFKSLDKVLSNTTSSASDVNIAMKDFNDKLTITADKTAAAQANSGILGQIGGLFGGGADFNRNLNREGIIGLLKSTKTSSNFEGLVGNKGNLQDDTDLLVSQTEGLSKRGQNILEKLLSKNKIGTFDTDANFDILRNFIKKADDTNLTLLKGFGFQRGDATQQRSLTGAIKSGNRVEVNTVLLDIFKKFTSNTSEFNASIVAFNNLVEKLNKVNLELDYTSKQISNINENFDKSFADVTSFGRGAIGGRSSIVNAFDNPLTASTGLLKSQGANLAGLTGNSSLQRQTDQLIALREVLDIVTKADFTAGVKAIDPKTGTAVSSIEGKVAEQLRASGIDKEIAGTIRGVIRESQNKDTGGENDPDTARRLSIEGISKMVEELAKPLAGFNKQQIEVFDTLTNNLKRMADLQAANAERLADIEGRRLDFANDILRLENKKVGLTEAGRGVNARIGGLTGGTSSLTTINANIGAAFGEIKKIQEGLGSDVSKEALEGFAKSFLDNNKVILQNTKALEILASDTTKLTAINAELASVEAEKQNSRNLIERLVTAGPSERIKINQDIKNAGILQSGGIKSLTADQIKGATDIIRQLAALEGPEFLEKTNADLTKAFLATGAIQGAGPDTDLGKIFERAGFAKGASDKEKGLITEARAAQKTMIDASNLLAKRSIELADTLSAVRDVLAGLQILKNVPTGATSVNPFLAKGGFVGGTFQGGDSVSAMLTPGEFVVKRSVAQRNKELLHSLNSNRFAGGGEVSDRTGIFPLRLSSIGTKQKKYNSLLDVAIDAEQANSYLPKVQREAAVKRAVKEYAQAIQRAEGTSRNTQRRLATMEGQKQGAANIKAGVFKYLDSSLINRPKATSFRDRGKLEAIKGGGQTLAGRGSSATTFFDGNKDIRLNDYEAARARMIARRASGKRFGESTEPDLRMSGDMLDPDFDIYSSGKGAIDISTTKITKIAKKAKRLSDSQQRIQLNKAKISGKLEEYIKSRSGTQDKVDVSKANVPLTANQARKLGGKALEKFKKDNFDYYESLRLNKIKDEEFLKKERIQNRKAGGFFANGGYVDSVPAMLTPGEFVVNREVARANLPFLRRLNSGTRFANGGPVGTSGGSGVTSSTNFNEVAGRLSEGLFRFSDAANKLNTSLEKLKDIPQNITMTGTHKVEVIINGGQVLTELLNGPLGNLVRDEIQKQMNKTINPLTGETT
jgi:hypothetical protein